VQIWNHPPHDLDCSLDRAALLTQEGSSAIFDTSSVLRRFRLSPILDSTDLMKTNLDRCAPSGEGFAPNIFPFWKVLVCDRA
jgi:hypothetical protein